LVFFNSEFKEIEAIRVLAAVVLPTQLPVECIAQDPLPRDIVVGVRS